MGDELSKFKFNEGCCTSCSKEGLNVVLETTREKILGLGCCSQAAESRRASFQRKEKLSNRRSNAVRSRV